MNQKWYWRMYRLLRLQRCYTKQPDDYAFQKMMSCSRSEIELVTSSNIMFHIRTKTHDGFFAPIYQHNDKYSFLRKVIYDYYTFVCKNQQFAENDREIVLRLIEEPENLNSFFGMGSVWIAGSPISIFLKTGDPSVIGLGGYPTDSASVNRLFDFVRNYAYGALHAYRQNSRNKPGMWQTASANRSMAVKALAKLLDISYMIPHSEYRLLIVDGCHQCFGIYTERAEGRDVTRIDASGRVQFLTPQLQRELNRLNMLDVLTCEIDHCPENYFLIVKESGAVGISVFDNNSEQNFPIRRGISNKTILQCSPYVNEKGLLNRPYTDEHVVARIREISLNELIKSLHPYLSIIPIVFLKIRLDRLKRAINKSLCSSWVHSLKYDEWTEQTLAHELEIYDDVRTYLHSYLKDCIHV